MPENYVAGISLASSNIKREETLKQLSAGGYGVEMCERALEQCENSEAEAAEALQCLLLGDPAATSRDPATIRAPSDGQTIWEQEIVTLHAIFGERITSLSSSKVSVELESSHLQETFSLHVQKSKSYPLTEPVINLVEKKLPAYIKLSIIRQATAQTQASYLGEPMVFHVISWLEEHMHDVIETPGRLRELSGISPMSPGAGCRKKGIERRRKPLPAAVDPKIRERESQILLHAWEKRQRTDLQKKFITERQKLPAWALKDEIAATVAKNQITIVTGETGSGKSTQTVQFVLDDLINKGFGSAANIVCTQPRRISALGLASRVSDERCCALGKGDVGYVIRGDAQRSGATKIIFMTTGVL